MHNILGATIAIESSTVGGRAIWQEEQEVEGYKDDVRIFPGRAQI